MISHGLLDLEGINECFECGGRVEHKDGDVVCVDCGLVYGPNYEADRIPFGSDAVEKGQSEGSYNPVNNSDYGKALGTLMDLKTRVGVLTGGKTKAGHFKQNPPNEHEVPRAKWLLIKLDDPLVKKFLDLMRDFCRNHDLDKKDDVDQIRFRDQLGLNLRYMAEYFLKYKKQKHDPWLVVASLFSNLLRDLYPERFRALQGKSPEIEWKIEQNEQKQKVGLDPDLTKYYGILLKTLSVPLLPELPLLSES